MGIGGPVQNVKTLANDPTRVGGAAQRAVGAGKPPHYIGAPGQDRSRNWPAIQETKQKEPQAVKNHARKFVVFFCPLEAMARARAQFPAAFHLDLT